MKKIFISHKCSKSNHTIADYLKRRFDHDNWQSFIDEFDLGDKTCQKVQEIIKTSTHFLLLLTPDAVNSQWVYIESCFAELCMNKEAICFLPIQIDQAEIIRPAKNVLQMKWNRQETSIEVIFERIIDFIAGKHPNRVLLSDNKVSEREFLHALEYKNLYIETKNLYYLRQGLASFRKAIEFDFSNYDAWAELSWCSKKISQDQKAADYQDIANRIKNI